MRSLTQMVLTAFAVGLMLGAGVTRTGRHLKAAHIYLFGADEEAPAADADMGAAGGGEAGESGDGNPSPKRQRTDAPCASSSRVRAAACLLSERAIAWSRLASRSRHITALSRRRLTRAERT